MSTSVRYVVGIDLGTTHCVMAASPADRVDVTVVPVPQLLGPGERVSQPVLPSFLYLPVEGELAPEDVALPWGRAPYPVGEIARRMGARSPTRLVASAKSWICYGGANRRAAILPWGAPDDAHHVSPYEASVRYLAHLRAAWEHAHPNAPLAAQDVVVTVPASFDEGARELTSAAAGEAGLGAVRLLEEPQAAFYDFLGERSRELDALLRAARLVLVVDVGGGTTDLTLLETVPHDASASGSERAPKLERIAVGGHLLLGGDNMDAALARHVADRAALDRALDPSEWAALMLAARTAKERLLAADAPGEAVVSIQRRGARLVGGTKSVAVTRDEARALLVEGFLPITAPESDAARGGRAGITSSGLPFVTDPAISRHLAGFLRRHVEAARRVGAQVTAGLARPDLVLLNGGVFNAPALVERFGRVLASWFGGPVPVVAHAALDTAVARGAVRFGLARRGLGDVIGGGTPRAYYIGVDGADGVRRALCVAPRGMDAGTTVEVPHRVFDLVLDRLVAFPLFSYTGDRVDPPGTLVPCDDELDVHAPLQTTLRSSGARLSAGESSTVRVTLSATVNESGTLETYLTAADRRSRRWRLAFAVGNDPPGNSPGARPGAAPAAARASAPPASPPDETAALPERFDAARALVLAVFGRGAGGPPDEARARSVRADLEALLGPRGEWSAATCRALWDLCMANKPGRARSATHELSWLRLIGWCLRPGVGAAGDAERVRALWQLHAEGLAHPKGDNRTEWWILWRRVAAGLDAAQQRRLLDDVRPYFVPAGKHAAPKGGARHAELLQLLAVLERLPAGDKEAAGQWLLERVEQVGSYWPLGRLGARVLLHGDPACVVPRDTARTWLAKLLALDWRKANGAALAAALIARISGDPARDLDADARKTVAARLIELSAPASWVDLVTREGALTSVDLGHVLGESLPAGLRMT